MYSAKQEISVGLFVILGILALFFTSFQVSGMTDLLTRPGYAVYANFDNIGSLRPRAAVSAGGVLVGRVKSIGYDNEKFLARVELTINDEFRFPSDSVASIHTSGLLGEQYISIDPGAEDDAIGPGGYFYNTESALVLENLINAIVGAVTED